MQSPIEAPWQQKARDLEGGVTGERRRGCRCAPVLKGVGIACDVGEEVGVGDRLDDARRDFAALLVMPQQASSLRPRFPAGRTHDDPMHDQRSLELVALQKLLQRALPVHAVRTSGTRVLHAWDACVVRAI
jgi:hypothetical protein